MNNNSLYLNIIGALLLIGGIIAKTFYFGGKYAMVAAIVGFVIILLIFLRKVLRK